MKQKATTSIYYILGLASGCHICHHSIIDQILALVPPNLPFLFPHTFHLKQRKQCNAIYYTQSCFFNLKMELLFLELCPCKCLSKLPITRHNVVASGNPAITCCDLERQALTVEVVIALPILPPVS